MPKGCLLAVLAILGVIVFLSLAGMSTYNGLVSNEERIEAAAAQIDNQYQRRFDLIPQLVETVKGAADFEQDTLQQVIDARSQASRVQLPESVINDPDGLQEYMAAQGQVGAALSRLFALSENYPTLKATDAFRDLQAQIEGTENRIAVARTDFIEAVRLYNTSRRKFPGNLFATAFGFEPAETLPADAEVRERPTIDFSEDG